MSKNAFGPPTHQYVRVCLLYALSIVFVSCGSREGAQPFDVQVAVVTDSAGIRVLSYRADLVEMSPSPLLSAEYAISGDTEELLENGKRVSGAVFLTSGEIAVGSRTLLQVGIFDANGNVLRRMGKLGGGPGEFRRLDGPWRLSDSSIALFDSRQRRLSAFDTSGRFLWSTSYGRTIDPDSNMFLSRIYGPVGHGYVLAQFQLFGPPTPGVAREKIRLYLVDSAGAGRILVSSLDGDERFIGRPIEDGSQLLATPPFGHRTLVAPCADGVVVADNANFEIRRYNLNGEITDLVRATRTKIAVHERHIKDEIVRQSGDRSAVTEASVAALTQMTTHENLPILRSIRCDSVGRLLVEVFAPPFADQRDIFLFSNEFASMEVFTVVGSEEILDFSADRVVLLTRGVDESATLHVRRFPRS